MQLSPASGFWGFLRFACFYVFNIHRVWGLLSRTPIVIHQSHSRFSAFRAAKNLVVSSRLSHHALLESNTIKGTKA